MGLTARYDSRTGKIYGCEEGTLTWWHEKGHEYLHNNGTHSLVELFAQYLIIFCLCFLIRDFKVYASICMLFYIGCIWFLEIAAWIYAFKMKKENPWQI